MRRPFPSVSVVWEADRGTTGPGFGEFKADYESIFERMRRARSGAVRAAVVDHGNPGIMHGAKAASAVACASDDEVLAGLLDTIPAHQFTFGRLTDLAEASGCTWPYSL